MISTYVSSSWGCFVGPAVSLIKSGALRPKSMTYSKALQKLKHFECHLPRAELLSERPTASKSSMVTCDPEVHEPTFVVSWQKLLPLQVDPQVEPPEA